MADIAISALAELTAPAASDVLVINDDSETVNDKTKKILFSTFRKAALADENGDTKITLDLSSNEDIIRFFTGAGGEQVAISDGFLLPAIDNDFSVGSATKRIKAIFAAAFGISASYSAAFPTNGVSGNSKIMIGDSSTIAWFYNNTAPPGWKIVATTDYVLRVGSTGGIAAGSWNITGLGSTGNASADHTHTTPNHSHPVTINASSQPAAPGSPPDAVVYVLGTSTTASITSSGAGTTSGISATHSHAGPSGDGSWRPASYIGKLCQLDTA